VARNFRHPTCPTPGRRSDPGARRRCTRSYCVVDREPIWEPDATSIRASIRAHSDAVRAWSAPPDHLSDDLALMVENYGSVSVVAVLLGGGPAGSVSVTRCDSLRIRPLRRALHLTCPAWLPVPAWPTSWPDHKPVRSRA
jgi:hypothetical protein